jgi:hypothetical protein
MQEDATCSTRAQQRVREWPTYTLSCHPQASPCTTYLTRHPRVLCGKLAQLCLCHQHTSESEYHRKCYTAGCFTHSCMCMRNVTVVCASSRQVDQRKCPIAYSSDAKKTLFWLITTEHHDREETDTITTVYHGMMLDHDLIILRSCAGVIERRTDSPFSNYFCQCLCAFARKAAMP